MSRRSTIVIQGRRTTAKRPQKTAPAACAPWVRWLPVLLLLACGLVLLPAYRFHVTTDGVAYLSIARHLVEGRLAAGLNPYWSPLLSWVVAPLLALGVPSLVAAKLAGLLAGVLVLLSVERLLRTLRVSDAARGAALIGLVPFVLHAAYTWISPDLLVAAPLLWMLDRLLGGRWTSSPAAAVGTGLLGGVAYLAKVYALPVVAVVVLTAAVAHLRTRGVGAWRAPALLVAGLAAVVLGWAGTISAVAGEATVGTASTVNVDFFVSGSPGSPLLREGLFPPPHPGSVTAWEDPSRLDPPVVGPADPAEADHRPRGLLPRLVDLSRNVPGNLSLSLATARRWWAAVVMILLGGGVLALRSRDPRHLGPPLVAAVWVAGLQLLIAQPRYLWAALLLLVPPAAALPDHLRSPSARKAALGLLLVVWLPTAWDELSLHQVRGPAAAVLADELAQAGVQPGDAVASDAAWHEGVHLCHHLRCRYHGLTRRGADDAAVAEELERHDIEWYFVWGQPPAFLTDTDGVPLTADGLAMTAYRVRGSEAGD